jgi:RimJ/RimL family protein N-acetyltransferase
MTIFEEILHATFTDRRAPAVVPDFYSEPAVTNFSNVSLVTPRLHLRPLHPSDAAAVHALFTDPGFMQYGTSAPFTSIDQAHALIALDWQALREGAHLRLGIERLDDATLIGVCTLFNLNTDFRSAELEYALRFDAWGEGYMHEALIALLHFGFTDLCMNRIEGEIDPRNTLSANSLERLGFTRERLLRECAYRLGEWTDSAQYSLLRREWKTRSQRTKVNHTQPTGSAPSAVKTRSSRAGIEHRLAEVRL